jgi:predicted MFS family arabinose efflux permease
VISGWGVRAPFVFDAVTFLIGAAALVPVTLRATAPQPRQSPFREAAGGVSLARAIPEVRHTLMLAAAVFCSWGAFFVLEPLYVRDVLHRSPVLLGLFQSAFGVGLLGATLVLPRIGDRVATLRALSASVVGSGVAAAMYVGTRSVVVAYAGVFVWGICVGFFWSPMQTLLQRATPLEAHGRVLSLATTLEGAGNMAGIPLAGIVVAAVGVRATGIGVGALALVAGVVGLGGSQRMARRSDTAASTHAASGTNHHMATPAWASTSVTSNVTTTPTAIPQSSPTMKSYQN